MVRHDGPAAFGDDRRVRDLRLVADGLEVVDHVGGVFLQRVVHARLEIGLRAVVIDARLNELDVDARSLVKGALDDADVRNLAAEMKMQQLEAVFHPAGLQLVQPFQDFSDGEAEFRPVAARRLPAAAAAGRQLHAHADRRPHADLFGQIEDEIELGVFLNNRNDPAPDFLRHHRQLDELRVFEAIADNRRVVVGKRHHGDQLGL